MKLSELVQKLNYRVLAGSGEVDVTSVVYDSRKIKQGAVFVCIKGAISAGQDFIPEMMEKGAVAFVVEQEDIKLIEGFTYIKVENARIALAEMSAAYFDYPAEKLKIIGITGTKGKTTTSYMIKAILEAAGIQTGLIGTIESIIGEERLPSKNTTPESYIIQETFRKMVDTGIEAVVMEVSSQALMMHRVAGFEFDIGIFTNLEPDHIGRNEHKDFEEYMKCKSLLFQNCKYGIFNGDSPYVENIMNSCTCEIETYGCAVNNDIRAEGIEFTKTQDALGVKYQLKGVLDSEIQVNIPGTFSVYNSLAAIATAVHFDADIEEVKSTLNKTMIRGRVEIVPGPQNYMIMIDYAHNALSLESLLTTLRKYGPSRLICLFGCGGNRSKVRRYEMGKMASQLADLTIVTSDNPRNEEPMDIIKDILIGVKEAKGAYVAIPDRKEAIRYCVEHAQSGDILVFAGKGHENYQEVKGVKYPMDERELIADIIKEKLTV